MSEQTFFKARAIIKQLVEDFADNEPTFLEAKYSEAQAWLDFITKINAEGAHAVRAQKRPN
jgi:hypothetical protein